MAGVMPKVMFYAFLSMIVLLINLSVFSTSLIATPNNINNFLGDDPFIPETPPNTDLTKYVDNKDTYTEDDMLENEGDTAISNFVLASGSSFIPFVSIISLAIISDLPIEMTIFTGLVLGIISAFQVFLLLVIVMNLVPKILGSGFDV